MTAPQAEGWTRRRFLGGLTVAGAAGLLGLTPGPAAEPPPETTRLPTVVCDQGLLDGVELWGLDPQGIPVVGPANDPMAVTAEARAPAAAGEGVTVGRRGPTVRHGQGQTASTARRETAVVGLAGRTTADP